MPLSVNWYDDEHSIIIVTITTDTTWNEYHQAVEWIVAEARMVDHRVDVIFHDNVGMPKGNPIPHLQQGSLKIINQPNIHLSIIAGTRGYSGFTRMILEAIGKSFSKVFFMKMPPKMPPNAGRTLLFLRNLDEALAHIQKDRAVPSPV